MISEIVTEQVLLDNYLQLLAEHQKNLNVRESRSIIQKLF